MGVDSGEEMCVNESFLGFAEASSTTGEELATQAMRGQGYDGAANMAGKFSSVRTRIQTEIPEVYYVDPLLCTLPESGCCQILSAPNCPQYN